MKKGKKMPSITLEGHSDARFELRDGKIVRVEGRSHAATGTGPMASGMPTQRPGAEPDLGAPRHDARD